MKTTKMNHKKFSQQNEMVRLKLRHLRESHKLDIRSVAAYLDITPNTYNEMEKGAKQIYLYRLFRLAEYYKIHITYFFQNESILSLTREKKMLEEQIAKKDEEIYSLQKKVIDVVSSKKIKSNS